MDPTIICCEFKLVAYLVWLILPNECMTTFKAVSSVPKFVIMK